MQLSLLETVFTYLLGYVTLLSGGTIWTHNNVGIGTFVMAMGVLVWGIAALSYCWYGLFD